jgi:dephospho-CoA kinase
MYSIMSERLLLPISGLPGSGKSTIAEYLRTEHGFATTSGSEILQKQARKLGKVLVLREDYHDFYLDMVEKQGTDFIARVGLALNQKKIALDGIRTVADMHYLIQEGAIPLAVTCKRNLRFERTHSLDPKYPSTMIEFVKADLMEDSLDELGPQVSSIMEEAHHIIDNNGSLEQLYQQVDDIIDIYTSQQG